MQLVCYFITFQDLSSIQDKIPQNKEGVFNGEFHMEFCDNRRQLFQAYFRDFQIELLENSWRAFTDGWHSEVASKNFGIKPSFMDEKFSYVLIRVTKFHNISRLISNLPNNQVRAKQKFL